MTKFTFVTYCTLELSLIYFFHFKIFDYYNIIYWVYHLLTCLGNTPKVSSISGDALTQLMVIYFIHYKYKPNKKLITIFFQLYNKNLLFYNYI